MVCQIFPISLRIMSQKEKKFFENDLINNKEKLIKEIKGKSIW